MQVIGLTGGVGSGKTLAAELLRDITGGELLIADNLGHVAMERDTVGYRQIVEAFGREILSGGGEIDRGKLSEQVFRDAGKLNRLNEIVHPQVKQYIEKYIFDRRKDEGVIILESAILFETACDKLCDEVWYVWVPKEVRIQRLRESRGYSEEKCRAIMAQQMREEEYRQKCQRTVCNDGSVDKLREILLRFTVDYDR